jgi:hypothetical protein
MQMSRNALVIFINKRLEELGLEMAPASKKIGKNHAYLQQFIKRGVPLTLPEDVRENLAVLLRVSEDDLRYQQKSGAPPEMLPDSDKPVAHNRTVGGSSTNIREETRMIGSGGLSETVLQDLVRRLTRLEDKVFSIKQDDPAPAQSDPTSRRKA